MQKRTILLLCFLLSAAVARGAEPPALVYAGYCSRCHGVDGRGTSEGPELPAGMSVDGLADVIARRMPPERPGVCAGDCARQLADYLARNLVDTPAPPPPSQRRLTRFEFRLAARDLFPFADLDAMPELPADGKVAGFEGGGAISEAQAEAYLETAEAVAGRAVVRLPPLACPFWETRPTCARRLIRVFGARAFRRRLHSDEGARLFALYQGARDHREGLRRVFAGLLLSPYFLYRSLPASVPASDREIAERLSFFLWGSLPDRRLRMLAESGKLATDAQIRAEARRLLAHRNARRGWRTFFRQWLDLESASSLFRSPSAFPSFDRARAREMDRAFDAFVERALWDEKGDLATLLLGNWDARDPERVGLFTQPLFLANGAGAMDSSPILRGARLLRAVLCHPLPPPPQDLPVISSAGGTTTRQRIEAHTAPARCQSCHRYLNPLGFGLEHFDALGAYRMTEAGLPIDASGIYPGGAFRFDGALSLARALSENDDVKTCFVRQVFRYATGRAEDDTDAADLASLEKNFRASGGNIRELLLAVTATRAFTSRTVNR